MPPLARGFDSDPAAQIVTEVRGEEALLKAGALQSAIFNSANFSSIATDAKGVIQIFNVGGEDAGLRGRPHVIQNAEFLAVWVERGGGDLDRRLPREFLRNRHACAESLQILLGKFLRVLQVGQLCIEVRSRVVEPVAVTVGAMNPKRTAQRVAKLIWAK